MQKEEVRQAVRRLMKQASPQELSLMSDNIISKLLSHPRVLSCNTIMMFHPLSDEPDIRKAIESLAAGGKTVLLPAVIGATQLQLRRYIGDVALAKGYFGIMEPQGTVFENYDLIDVIIVPGVAFDAKLHRLGRGRGYYDRFLPLVSWAYKIGICFDFQKFEEIPSEAHDVLMDEIL